jgi:hypothetical protein
MASSNLAASAAKDISKCINPPTFVGNGTPKFIPDSDSEFLSMAENFAGCIARNPDRFMISAEDAEYLSRLVVAYHDAHLQVAMPGTKTTALVRAKDDARKQAEIVIREHANFIRGNPFINRADLVLLRMKERPARPLRRKCPETPPVLSFVRAIDDIGDPRAVHVLEFRDRAKDGHKARPRGAARVELFVALLPPDAPVPDQPGDEARYLRSYTKNPIKVHFPIPSIPMLIVYWARWADVSCEVGPYSATAVARIEGHSPRTLPGTQVKQIKKDLRLGDEPEEQLALPAATNWRSLEHMNNRAQGLLVAQTRCAFVQALPQSHE